MLGGVLGGSTSSWQGTGSLCCGASSAGMASRAMCCAHHHCCFRCCLSPAEWLSTVQAREPAFLGFDPTGGNENNIIVSGECWVPGLCSLDGIACDLLLNVVARQSATGSCAAAHCQRVVQPALLCLAALPALSAAALAAASPISVALVQARGQALCAAAAAAFGASRSITCRMNAPQLDPINDYSAEVQPLRANCHVFEILVSVLETGGWSTGFMCLVGWAAWRPCASARPSGCSCGPRCRHLACGLACEGSSAAGANQRRQLALWCSMQLGHRSVLAAFTISDIKRGQ